MFRRSMHKRTLTRILLAGLAVGAVVAGTAKANADPDSDMVEAGQVVCTELSATNYHAAMDQLSLSLIADGYDPTAIGKVFRYDVEHVCPGKLWKLLEWSDHVLETVTGAPTHTAGIIA